MSPITALGLLALQVISAVAVIASGAWVVHEQEEDIDNAPSIDAEPVRHGQWLITAAYPHRVYCSQCFRTFAHEHWEIWQDGSLPRRYCPNCGAKNEEEQR